MTSVTHSRPLRNIKSKRLRKIWHIDHYTSTRTIDITSKNCGRVGNPELPWNYNTDDKIISYMQIKEYFFIDIFFATNKDGKSSRGHTCCQLFY